MPNHAFKGALLVSLIEGYFEFRRRECVLTYCHLILKFATLRSVSRDLQSILLAQQAQY
jgi:hypothetical protein